MTAHASLHRESSDGVVHSPAFMVVCPCSRPRGHFVARVSKRGAMANNLNTNESLSESHARQCGTSAAMWLECPRGKAQLQIGSTAIAIGPSVAFAISGHLQHHPAQAQRVAYHGH